MLLSCLCFLHTVIHFKKCDTIKSDIIPQVISVLSTYIISLILSVAFLEEGYVKMYLKGRPITMFMPKDQVDSYCLEARADLPSNKLKLDWVYPFAASFFFFFFLIAQRK